MAEYAHPESLVSTDWVAKHLKDPTIRIVEVDVDHSLYVGGHIDGAVGLNWSTQLADQLTRDILDKPSFEELAAAAGITPQTTVLLYGDANNWFAAWAFWEFKIYGHKDVRLINGGRKKWELEGRHYSVEVPAVQRTSYMASEPDLSLRAFREELLNQVKTGGISLVDVRSPDEYSGKVLAPPGLNETAQRGGHIPGAKNVPWALAVQEDGTFKNADDLKDLYEVKAGIDKSSATVAYCRIGERSSHTWFVLKYLLGHDNVKNYDGSWTEWGSVVGAPIEK
jgi:thiosulfate/3-mercaptopyruvate sulfurtransferase